MLGQAVVDGPIIDVPTIQSGRVLLLRCENFISPFEVTTLPVSFEVRNLPVRVFWPLIRVRVLEEGCRHEMRSVTVRGKSDYCGFTNLLCKGWHE
jgi:hypothetical protein